MLTLAAWDSVPSLCHGFLDAGEPNRRSWEPATGTSLPILVPRQVHGTRVVTAGVGVEPPEADGVVTADRGLLVGIFTADCVPVLLVDRRRRVAAAVHAGWRGSAAGVLEAAVDHLRARFGTKPGDLEAAIGPAVAGCCYEVGPNVEEAFRARIGGSTDPAWSTRGGRRHVDLRTAARLMLQAAGVASVEILGPCTVCSAGYHSYRRDGAGAGRQLSFVGWA